MPILVLVQNAGFSKAGSHSVQGMKLPDCPSNSKFHNEEKDGFPPCPPGVQSESLVCVVALEKDGLFPADYALFRLPG